MDEFSSAGDLLDSICFWTVYIRFSRDWLVILFCWLISLQLVSGYCSLYQVFTSWSVKGHCICMRNFFHVSGCVILLVKVICFEAALDSSTTCQFNLEFGSSDEWFLPVFWSFLTPQMRMLVSDGIVQRPLGACGIVFKWLASYISSLSLWWAYIVHS